tara:strand:+ start:2521 stop:3567 length:1047 start_codon:yes stop_codon:yes gene_type:complete
LDGAVATIPDPHMLVYAFMRQEAVLSSQIEGTQASLEDLLEYEIDHELTGELRDVFEIVNYLNAMQWAVDAIKKKPITLNLIKEAHAILLSAGRGATRGPGDFRQNQNWIGSAGCEIDEATFVPPSVPLMKEALYELEKYINTRDGLPDLVQCALIHAQFETIHPFWDGNGRLGRMLITLLLCEREVLELPVLYLSLYFKSNREEYYQRLQNVRDRGQWEEWVIFFLRGITVTSRSALNAAKEIRALRERMVSESKAITKSPSAVAFGEFLFQRSYITANLVSNNLGVSPPTANNLIDAYVDAGYLVQANSGRRNRVFAFKPYLDILHECADDLTEVLGEQDHLATNS